MLKELGLVVTGVAIGVVGTLYVTKDFLLEGFAHKLSEVIDEEVQDVKDELCNEQVDKDNRRDYTKPLRKDKAFSTSYKAATILAAMTQHCNTYGQVTLADYYKLIGQTPTNVNGDYGWTDLSGATISEIASGAYTIHMPVAKKLNK